MKQHVCCSGCEPDAHIAHPSTPRVAESLDDLRVGQVVAWHDAASDRWDVYTADDESLNLRERHTYADNEPFFAALDAGEIFILSDPPPEPVQVPADLIDALAEALTASAGMRDPAIRLDTISYAARAVVDAARNGTDQ